MKHKEESFLGFYDWFQDDGAWLWIIIAIVVILVFFVEED